MTALVIITCLAVVGMGAVSWLALRFAERVATRALASDKTWVPGKEPGQPQHDLPAKDELAQYMDEERSLRAMDRFLGRAGEVAGGE